MSILDSRWQEASYHPGQFGSDSYLIIRVPGGRVHCFPDPCFSQARRGETPVMGSPEVAERTYGPRGWEGIRPPSPHSALRVRVLNLTTGQLSAQSFQSVREAQIWAEEQINVSR
jgi:hypothetical protein